MSGGSRSTILAFHAVGDCPGGGRHERCVCIPTESFAKQMAFLARHRRVVALKTLIEGELPPGPPAVAITFDDGYRNVLLNGVPILREHGFAATVFVPTKWIGTTNAWDAGKRCFPLEIMDEGELRRAEGQGIAIESHGHAHLHYERADPAVVAHDLRSSIERLDDILGRRPRYLAYPYGAHSAAVRALVQDADFEDAFLFNELGVGRFGRERVSVDGYESSVRLTLKTAGGYLAHRRSPIGSCAAVVVRRLRRRPSDP